MTFCMWLFVLQSFWRCTRHGSVNYRNVILLLFSVSRLFQRFYTGWKYCMLYERKIPVLWKPECIYAFFNCCKYINIYVWLCFIDITICYGCFVYTCKSIFRGFGKSVTYTVLQENKWQSLRCRMFSDLIL